MSQEAEGKTRLESWKQVAAYFGRADRTVKRWEVERGLPIHRLPGSPKSRIYAEVAELEAWRRGAPVCVVEEEVAVAPSAPVPTAPAQREPAPRMALSARRLTRGASVGVATLVAVAVLALLANVPVIGVRLPRPMVSIARRPAPLEAQRLYLAGMDDWARRTPASLNRAVGEFNAAIARDGDYAEAYAGLAGCYDLMREFTLMPSSQAFPLAKAAAERALALDDRLAAAHASLAFADFYGFWDTAGARREFARAIALDPRNATARHWFATYLTVQGDGQGALREIDAAHRLEPAAPAIAADRAWIMYMYGDKARGLTDLMSAELANADFLSPHTYLALIDLLEGRNDGYISETIAVARLTHDPARLLTARAAWSGFRSGGRRGLLQALLAAQVDQFQNGAGGAYPVAQTYALLGDPSGATAYLKLAVDRREMAAVGMAFDPNFAPLRNDPRFQRLARRS